MIEINTKYIILFFWVMQNEAVVFDLVAVVVVDLSELINFLEDSFSNRSFVDAKIFKIFWAQIQQLDAGDEVLLEDEGELAETDKVEPLGDLLHGPLGGVSLGN